ncbi:MAG: DNA-directed RNA polymerase subunit beta [Candidatus Pacebacteria bacterium]|nr:DNA-directed RNA polymerase subunit beta [Candidatus Paceibacterota bacterium]
MKVKNFSKAKLNLPYTDLLMVQKQSWKRFWESDLKDLFSEISPIQDYTKKRFELWFLDFKLGKSKYKSGLEAMEQNDSYKAPLKVNIKLVNLQTKESKTQAIFLCDFPLMTKKGTFIINGIERVAISQLIRSPGAFFTSQRLKGKERFGAKIIPNRGAWLEFQTDSSGFIGVKIDRRRKIAATTLLKAFGIEKDSEIKDLFKDVNVGELDYIKETFQRDTTQNPGEALMEIYNRLRPGEMVTPETAKELIDNMFFNFKRYDLSKVGRWKTWQRLPKLKPKTQKQKNKQEDEVKVDDRVLKLQDVIEVVREIIRLNNTPGSVADQIDHLGNRRVRVFTEVLVSNLRLGLMRMERIIKDRMAFLDAATITPGQLINARPLMMQIQGFFASSQMSQFMDNENPLAELEHKRRLAATGPGGLTKERAGFEARDVQPSHYGRICPIQTPEGQNVGLINYLSIYAKVNAYGFIETPYFKVKNRKVTKELEYLSAYEGEKYTIASGLILIDDFGKILPDKVEARIKGEPGVVDSSQVEFIDVSPNQILSVSTACIPFLENNDANRALMGSNMQRQAVPVIMPESPLVFTGVEKRIATDSGRQITVDEDGIVTEVDGGKIKVKFKNSKLKEKVYILDTFLKTNKDTCLHQKPVVVKNQAVSKGDVLAEGGAVNQGNLALGKNIFLAFLPWRGANFEDAMIISDKLLKDDTFSSIHIKSYVCNVRDTKLGPEITTWDIPNVSEEKLKDLDQDGIIRIGAIVGSNDILVGKISPKGKEELTSEERLLKAIFGEKAREVKDTSLVMKYGEEGRVIQVKVFSREKGHQLEPGVIKRIEVRVAQLRKISVGDKLANRHGNKGVIAKILPQEDMPFTEDGTPVDIILNPTGVGKRMNLGQVFETHMGFAAKKLGYSALCPPLSGLSSEDVEKELKKAGIPESGKIKLYDGQTGKPFSQDITVGYMYVIKLGHLVDDKIHMRSIGPYSLITQQPLGGKAQFGGQRFGEMEVWALEGYGAANTLQEMLTIKSDDVVGRAATYQSILKGEEIKPPTVPASFNLLVNELKALGLNIQIKKEKK